MPDQATVRPPRGRRIIALLLLVIVAAAVAWWLVGRKVWTDGATLTVSDAETRVREVVWGQPHDLPDLINTAGQEYEPSLSPDGQELYFVRGKPGSGAHIYVSHREGKNWSNPEPVFKPTEAADDLGPRVTLDGRFLVFYSDRPGGLGGYDIWAAPRLADGAWGKPFNLGPTVNSEFNEFSPDPTPDGTHLIFATNRKAALREQKEAWAATIRQTNSADYDLWIAESAEVPGQDNVAGPASRPTTNPAEANARASPFPPTPSLPGGTNQMLSFKPATEIAGVNTPFTEGASCMSPAGDFLYFASNRPGGFGKFDIYRCRVQNWKFGPVENVGSPINTAANEVDPALGMGGYQLFFSSDRSGGRGGYDLFTSDSREVFAQHAAHPLPHLGYSAWVMLASLVVLVPLLLALRGLGERRLNLLQKCLLVSLLIHVLITFALSFIMVSQQVGQYVKQETGLDLGLSLPKELEEALAIRNPLSSDLPSHAADPAPTERAQGPAAQVTETLPPAPNLDVEAPRAAASPGVWQIAVAPPKAEKLESPAEPVRVRPAEEPTQAISVAPASPPVRPPLAAVEPNMVSAIPSPPSNAGKQTNAEVVASPPVIGSPTAVAPARPRTASLTDQAQVHVDVPAVAYEAAPPRPQGPTPNSIEKPNPPAVAAAIRSPVFSPETDLAVAAAPTARPAIRQPGPTGDVSSKFAAQLPPTPSVDFQAQSAKVEPALAAHSSAVPEVSSAGVQVRADNGNNSGLIAGPDAAIASAAHPAAVAPEKQPEASDVGAPSSIGRIAPGAAGPMSAPPTLALGSARSDAAPTTRPMFLAAALPGLAVPSGTLTAPAPAASSEMKTVGPAVDVTTPVASVNVAVQEAAASPFVEIFPSATTRPVAPEPLAGRIGAPEAIKSPDPGPHEVSVKRDSLPALSADSSPRLRSGFATNPGVSNPVASAGPLADLHPVLPHQNRGLQADFNPATPDRVASRPDEISNAIRSERIDSDIHPPAIVTPQAEAMPSSQPLALSGTTPPAPGASFAAAKVVGPAVQLGGAAEPAPVGELDSGPAVSLPSHSTYGLASKAPEVATPSVSNSPKDDPLARRLYSSTPSPEMAGKPGDLGFGAKATSAESIQPRPEAIVDGAHQLPSHLSRKHPLLLSDDVPNPEVAVAPLAGTQGPGRLTAPDSPYAQRAPEQRKTLVEKMGGTHESEAAVERGLAYLARFQEPDGRWTYVDNDQPPGQRPRAPHDMAYTALSVLAFLGQDHAPSKPGPYRDVVRRGIEFLLAQQDGNGDLRGPAELRGPGSARGNLYDQGIATLALAETALVTHDQRCTNAALAGARFIIESQNHETGGWRYSPQEPGDTSVFGWEIMALHSAEMLGFETPDIARKREWKFVSYATLGKHGMLGCYLPNGNPTPAMTAEMAFCRMLMGQHLNDAEVREATDFLAQEPPDLSRPDLYYWYYASLSMMQMQSHAWKVWNAYTRDGLVRMQQRGGPADGAWKVSMKRAERAGNIFTTVMGTLTLEVYYRYLPLNSPPLGHP